MPHRQAPACLYIALPSGHWPLVRHIVATLRSGDRPPARRGLAAPRHAPGPWPSRASGGLRRSPAVLAAHGFGARDPSLTARSCASSLGGTCGPACRDCPQDAQRRPEASPRAVLHRQGACLQRCIEGATGRTKVMGSTFGSSDAMTRLSSVVLSKCW